MWKFVVFWSAIVCVVAEKHSHIVLFKRPHYKGVPEQFLEHHYDLCKTFDIPSRVLSLKVHENCIIIYPTRDCEGSNYTKITNDEPDVNLDAVSVKYC